jgi:hypothetical protein
MPRFNVTALVKTRLTEGVAHDDIYRECLRYNPKWKRAWITTIAASMTPIVPSITNTNTTTSQDDCFEFDPTMKFGIEFEILLPRSLEGSVLVDKLTAAGVTTKVEGYNHENRRHWKLTTDASIHGNSNYYGLELVSPILKGHNDLNEVKIVCEKMTELGCKVNKSCGYHVHHASEDHQGHKTDEIAKISAVLYKKWQRKFNAMLPVSRRNSQYAQSFTSNELTSLKNNGSQMISTRYKVVNVLAYGRHGTVEFRQHSGTIDKDKAINWIKITMAIVKRAKEIHKNNVDAWTCNFDQMEKELKLHPNLISFIKSRVEHFAQREIGIPEDERLRETA